MTTTLSPFQDAAGWERTLYAFLAEKEQPGGSQLQHPQSLPDASSLALLASCV